ncbi:hypothetical protein O6H91_03G130200 [Diphasiastrum complanatum]|uniref:Uncharacterized protein n=1 Tax=Diphasiastrum complanatum TaxID=34168 RepID=A0ACC2EBW1_DIPCM|nr:hypothetical protein O6H91_03G130200 [Diphasiastrum complanatum]
MQRRRLFAQSISALILHRSTKTKGSLDGVLNWRQLTELKPSFAQGDLSRGLRTFPKGQGAGEGRRLLTASATFAPHAVGTAVPVETVQLVAGGTIAKKRVAYWLFGCTGWVFSMVVLGGVTRLTKSGLSMTDWKFTGNLPPMSPKEWEAEFEKYQKSPEYQRVNKGMPLEKFKFIYWMEYAHRMWGRGLGIFFAVPFTYFLARGFITQRLALRLSVLLAMGAGQGFVGWWMVKSGLEEPESEYSQPRVSPYRLAAHLISAFAIYSGLLWTSLSVAMPEPNSNATQAVLQASNRVRRWIIPTAFLVGVTAMSGAFVAGNDAGHAFNTFPKMGDHWIPEGILHVQPSIRNFFENTATVQFDHRVLATTTLLSIAGIWTLARKLPLQPSTRTLLTCALGMTAIQVTLGISTLLMYVPVSLGAAHQAGALTLFSIVIALLHSLRRPHPYLLQTLSFNCTSSKLASQMIGVAAQRPPISMKSP